MTIPYTYLIGWPELDTWYYGVRWRPGCDPTDLWVKYFTSSKHVKAFRAQHGEPKVIRITRVFAEPAEARKWEHRVLSRLKADVNPKFLNKTVDNVPTMLGRKHSEETKKKIREAQQGRPKNPVSVAKMRESQIKRLAEGYTDSEETRKKKSLSHIGKAKSDECKEKLAELKRGAIWWNNGQTTRSSKESPGEGWVRGRLPLKRKKGAEAPF